MYHHAGIALTLITVAERESQSQWTRYCPYQNKKQIAASPARVVEVIAEGYSHDNPVGGFLREVDWLENVDDWK